MIRPTLLVAALLALPGTATAQPPGSRPVVGQPLAEFAATADWTIQLPTAVAVGPDDVVYVADGVNDRLVRFAPDGRRLEDLRRIGSESLANPSGLKFDAAGRLWIVDAGHHRVLVRGPDGSLERVIAPPAEGSRLPDLAAAAPSPDGRFLWLTDNDHHQLLRWDLQSNAERGFGRRGESLGEFQYPFDLAVTAGGDVLVTDVLNGRVQRLDRDGVPAGSIGSFGVELGQFYRPKGLAIDAAGQLWVADGTLQAVQVFGPDGALLDALRDDSGQIIRFDLPMGLAFDREGSLYVVEMLAGRVKKLGVTVSSGAPRPTPQSARGRTAVGAQARACTVCHLEWMKPLVDGQATELAAVPPNPRQQPWVSRPDQCLGCHDGSVADSRRRVWVEHGHQTGTVPANVHVPPDLPLAFGKIACRTCHSAHTRAGSGTAVEQIVFLRVKSSANELCSRCHLGLDAGLPAGMHPLADATATPTPASNSAAGSPNPRAVTCLGCHTGHGARYPKLLAQSVAHNDLCLDCHKSLTPDLFGDHARAGHAARPPLDQAQLAVAESFHATIGTDNSLACATCHRSHHAPATQHLLAFDPAERDICGECHLAQQPVVGTSHDLRPALSAASEPSTRQDAAAYVCASCHGAHRDVLVPVPTATDPVGRCAACHRDGGSAAKRQLGPENHSGAACRDCHDPHQAANSNYLLAAAQDVCRTCHYPESHLAGGVHDLSLKPAAWPEPAAATRDACLACHRPHGTRETGRLRVAAAGDPRAPGAACIACHQSAAPNAATKTALIHPFAVVDPHLEHDLPQPTDDQGRPLVACQSCHDPHSSEPPSQKLLRLTSSEQPFALCQTCHRDQANVSMIGHGISPLRTAGFEPANCGPCHATHADPQQTDRRFLLPRSLSDYPDAAAQPAASRVCIGCHRPGGPVAPPAIASHPAAEMYNATTPDSPGYLPLFNEPGEVDPKGRIVCRTCHLTHGRREPAPMPPNASTATAREIRARVWHIRSFGPGAVCATCHGFDALRRFMYFHDPARRGGPIEGPGTAPAPARPPA